MCDCVAKSELRYKEHIMAFVKGDGLFNIVGRSMRPDSQRCLITTSRANP